MESEWQVAASPLVSPSPRTQCFQTWTWILPSECVFLTLPLYESSVFQSPRLESLELPLTRSHLLPLLLSLIASRRSFLPHLSQPSFVLCSNLRGFFQLPNPPPFGNPLTYSLCVFFLMSFLLLNDQPPGQGARSFLCHLQFQQSVCVRWTRRKQLLDGGSWGSGLVNWASLLWAWPAVGQGVQPRAVPPAFGPWVTHPTGKLSSGRGCPGCWPSGIVPGDISL